MCATAPRSFADLPMRRVIAICGTLWVCWRQACIEFNLRTQRHRACLGTEVLGRFEKVREAAGQHFLCDAATLADPASAARSHRRTLLVVASWLASAAARSVPSLLVTLSALPRALVRLVAKLPMSLELRFCAKPPFAPLEPRPASEAPLEAWIELLRPCPRGAAPLKRSSLKAIPLAAELGKPASNRPKGRDTSHHTTPNQSAHTLLLS